MHLQELTIKNFRSLKELKMGFSPGVNLIVGPNAVGKTTVLEAIRLAKAVLAPRTADETTHVLLSLGAVSQQLPQMFNFRAIAKDDSQPVEITCGYKLSDADISLLPRIYNELCRAMVAAQQGIRDDRGGLALVQFLSSPVGKASLAQAGKFVDEHLPRVVSTRTCNLSLVIDLAHGMSGQDYFSQTLFAVVESRLSPFKTTFSYFPADRALPQGEIAIQLGTPDAHQQLQSHNATPAAKYQRLKNTIFAAMVESTESKERLAQIFETIFGTLLVGREIKDFGINKHGQASILVRDTSTGEVFDIDAMSSGEKGLILTFLVIARSLEDGGLILLDEPELHLNPAVCKLLLPFLLDNYLVPKQIQAIICSHSSEIFSTAMRRDDCTAYHLRQGGVVSEVRKRDQPEVAQALRLLGTSEVEEMLYEAVIFVEGQDDVDLLEEAFPEMLSRLKFRDLSGRAEVEKHIARLQEAEQAGQKESLTYFLFDRDDRATRLHPTALVKIKQWNRYCMENYLLEPELIFDLVRNEGYATKNFPSSIGDAKALFQEIAKAQLLTRVIRETYESYGYPDLSMRMKEIVGRTLHDAAASQFDRIDAVQQKVASLDRVQWTAEFVEKCRRLLQEREQDWLDSWIKKCSGKQFFQDLYARCGIVIAPLKFKRQLLKECKFSGAEGWKLLESEFKALIK